MGRKVLTAVLVVLLTTGVFTGSMLAAKQYNDGTYVGFSDADRRGYTLAVVTIENDKIADVELVELDETATPKREDYPWPEFHEAMVTLPQRFVEANSADIDGYAKATGTSNQARQAVARALDKALVVKEGGKYQDGTFYGKSADFGNGAGVAWVTIQDDNIVHVELDELLADGSWKDWETYPWEPIVEGKPIMEKQIVQANGTNVDNITKATGSSEMYKEAVEIALEYARRGE